MLSLDGRSYASTSPPESRYHSMDAYKQINGALQEDHQHHRHMWIITGPAGCGKSSIAEYLATELSIPYIEGDDVARFTIRSVGISC